MPKPKYLNTGRSRFNIHRFLVTLLWGLLLGYLLAIFNLVAIPLFQIPAKDDLFLLLIDILFFAILFLYLLRKALKHKYFSFRKFRASAFDDWDAYLIVCSLESTPLDKIKQLQKNEIKSSIDTKKLKSELQQKIPLSQLLIMVLVFSLGITFLTVTISKNNRLHHVFFQPNTAFKNEPLVHFTNNVKKNVIREGDSLRFICSVDNQRVQNIQVELQSVATKEKRLFKMQPLAGNFVSPKIPLLESVLYRYSGELNEGVSQRKIFSSQYDTVQVLKNPGLKNLAISVLPPPYTKLPPEAYSDNQSIIYCYPGSKVKLNMGFDFAVDSIFILEKYRQITNFNHTDSVNYAFSIFKDKEISIRWKHYDSLTYVYPLALNFKQLKDSPPVIKVISPAGDIQLGDELRVPFLIRLWDDFGFSKLVLEKKRLNDNRDTLVSVTSLNSLLEKNNEQRIHTVLDFFKDYLAPGEEFKIRFKVVDNNPFRPGNAHSRWILVTLLSMDQLMNNFNQAGENYRNESGRSENQLKEIRKQLENRLKASYNPENNKRTKADFGNELQYATDSMRKSLEKQDELLTKLLKEAEHVLQPETIQKYSEIQEMIRQLLGHNLLEQLKKLSENERKISLNDLQKALKKAKESADDFAERLEQIHNLFKKLEVEKQFDLMEKYYDKMIENLKKMPLNEKVLDRQTQELDKMRKTLDEEMRETSSLLEELDKKNLSNDLDSLQHDLNKVDFSVLSGDKKVSGMSNLSRQKKQLRKIKEKFISGEQHNILEHIQQQILSLLNYSFFQEKLNEQYEKLSRVSSEIPRLAIMQKEMDMFFKEIAGGIVELQNQTFFIPAKINRILRQIRFSNKIIMNSLEQRQLYKVKPEAQKLLENSNQTIKILLDVAEIIKNSSSASGMQQFLEQMQALAKQQANVNQQSQQMMQKMGNGNLSKESLMRELARIASMQSAVQKGMKQLMDSFGQGRGEKAVLSKLEKELKELSGDLQKRKMNKDLIQKQNKVLQNMLELSQSLNTKDKSKKREAEAAQSYKIKTPAQLSKEIQQKNLIWEAYRQALKNTNDPDMKKILKEYYEELLQNSK